MWHALFVAVSTAVFMGLLHSHASRRNPGRDPETIEYSPERLLSINPPPPVSSTVFMCITGVVFASSTTAVDTENTFILPSSRHTQNRITISVGVGSRLDDVAEQTLCGKTKSSIQQDTLNPHRKYLISIQRIPMSITWSRSKQSSLCFN